MAIERVARTQKGVVTRAQALQAGMTPKQVRWRVDSGDWQRLHRGIYLTNTGATTWPARAWAGLLWCGAGSALILESACYVWRVHQSEPPVITVGTPFGRAHRAPLGVRAIRRRRLEAGNVDGFRATRMAQTVIDLADDPAWSLDDIVALAAKACQQRKVTAQRLLDELATRRRHRCRRELRLALGHIEAGAESLPEVHFVTKVQRSHGLPEFERQVRLAGEPHRTDLRNARYRVRVEIDGRLWHAGAAFHTDRRRDRKATGGGDLSVRVTPLEIDQDPCELAVDTAMVLRQRGWTGQLLSCSSGCAGGRPLATR